MKNCAKKPVYNEERSMSLSPDKAVRRSCRKKIMKKAKNQTARRFWVLSLALILLFQLSACRAGESSSSSGSMSGQPAASSSSTESEDYSSGAPANGSSASSTEPGDPGDVSPSAGGPVSSAESGNPGEVSSAAGDPVSSAQPADPGAPASSASISAGTTVPENPVSPPQPPETMDTYFNDTVFIGDSIMEGIHLYVSAQRSSRPMLGNAFFLTSLYGVNITTLAQDGSGYRYQGEEQTLAQILSQLPCKRIFILLGLNDLEAADPVIENIINSYRSLIGQIKDMVPGAEVIVMTNTPKISSYWLPDYTINRNFNNDLITAFAGAVINMCETEGIPYVDTSSDLKDANGYLKEEYCSDGFLHLNYDGAAVVVNALERYAEAALQLQ